MPKKSKTKQDSLKTKKDLEARKKLKAHKYKAEAYLAKVDLCVKEGGKWMDCSLKIRDEIQKAEKEKKAKAKKK